MASGYRRFRLAMSPKKSVVSILEPACLFCWNGVFHAFTAIPGLLGHPIMNAASQGIRPDQLEAFESDTAFEAMYGELRKLAAQDPQKARLVERRFFVGMTLEEAASALQVSKSTADRWWSYSRAWLQKAMES